MQFQGQGKPPVGVIFDCDFGNNIDDALALALLYGFDGKNELRVVSLSVSKPNLNAAALCDIIGRFYAGVLQTPFGSFSRALMVGLADTGKAPEDTPMLTEPLAKKDDKGAPAFNRNIRELNDTAEVPALLRNALTAQHDGNCMAVLAGPATNLVSILRLPGAKELIERKVRFLTVTAGSYPSGAPDWNVKADIAAAKKLFAEWPTPIVAVGAEMGDAVLYPAASIEKDFAWSPAHPVVEAYRAFKPMPYDASTTPMAAVLYAARPQEGYFKLSDPGTITISDDGRTQFAASATGKHRYLIADPAQQERILKTYTELASAKPVPRTFRRQNQQQQNQQQQQQPQPPKPAEVKPSGN
jgi:inosine-uridine nucleoside N-ribohydrolase